MADIFEPGNRVSLPNGEFATIVRVDGGMAHVQLDNGDRKTAATASLDLIRSGDDKPNWRQ